VDPPADLDSYRHRESSLVYLNLWVVGALVVVHSIFTELLGAPSTVLLSGLALLCALQVASLVWLRGLRRLPGPRARTLYPALSIGITIAVGFIVSMFGEGEEHHYFVLMLPPVISAAFRYPIKGALAIAALAGALTIFDVWYSFRDFSAAGVYELFEGATACLVFLVVSVVVGTLAAHLRLEERRLRGSLSELERARDRLVAEEKLAAVGRLSAAIAHEIRNPVAMISSSLAASHREDRTPEVRRQLLDIAGQEAERLERLTRDFLAYAHTRAPERKRTPLASTLGYVADLARGRASEIPVAMRTECADALHAYLDPFQTHQALLNLVMNALEATPAGGTVTLGARNGAASGVTLFVENTGPAIGDEVIARIFEPFFTTRPGGTGLGLAIARNIARAHGGELELTANEPGRVRFELSVPDASPPAAR
jgi:signal transduction histidine kinase